MNIDLESAGKRFNNDWIFRDLNFSISPASPMVITGGNGSGKSTLLKIISSNLSLSEGKIIYTDNGKVIDIDKVYSYVSIASPYLSIYDFYSLREAVSFQLSLRPSRFTTQEIIEFTGLKDSSKHLKYFSSGMLQRVKLTLAMTSSSDILLLDEPISNLDRKGVQWYKEMASMFCKDRSVVVFSNHMPDEHFFCASSLDLSSK